MSAGPAHDRQLRHEDPGGHYALLGVSTDASSAEITAAFRRQVRVLHPDIPGTGSLDRFLAVKQAYDLLSDPDKRLSYDRTARLTASRAREPSETEFPRPPTMVEPAMRRPRLSDMHYGVWIGLALVILLCAQQLAWRLSRSEPESVVTRPVIPSVARTDSAPGGRTIPQQPDIIAGVPNHYTTPGHGPITVWRHDTEGSRLVPIGQLEPFTPVQALRLNRASGLMEVRLSDTTSGFVQSARLAPGNQAASRRAFCIFHSGPPPAGPEIVKKTSSGPVSLRTINRDASPAVVKLRDQTGLVVAMIYLPPGEEAWITDLPDTLLVADFAHGEVWSQPCGGFAVGQRAWRIPAYQPLGSLTSLVIPPDPSLPGQPVALPDQTFLAD